MRQAPHVGTPWPIAAPEPLGHVERGEPPTLSVFIPYYRGAAFIRAAVDSVLEQTLQPDEIVICDDGSPDDLEGALGPAREHVRIVRQANGGVGSAMDRAVRAATGEFVVWLDQDDAFLPGRLEAIAATAVERPDLDVIATDALLEYEGEVVARLSEVMPFRTERQRLAIVGGTAFFLWPAIRRSRLLAVGGFDGSFKVVADFDCFVRLILDGALVGYVDEPLYRYRLNPDSLISDVAGHLREVARALTGALERGDLGPAERERAESQIAAAERDALARDARRAVEERRHDARRRSLGLLLGRGSPAGLRAKAAVAVVSPGLARRFLATRTSRRGPGVEAFLDRMGRLPPR